MDGKGNETVEGEKEGGVVTKSHADRWIGQCTCKEQQSCKQVPTNRSQNRPWITRGDQTVG